MKNREKFAKEILDVVCKGNHFGVTKADEIISCPEADCRKCLFDDDIDCDISLEQWSESEYVEKPIITSREKAFLYSLLPEWKYITRDKDYRLFLYPDKPSKKSTYWSSETKGENRIRHDVFNVKFDFVKWEDEEPWSIEDLKKLEVRDE